MSTAKPRVIVTRKLPDAVETRMRELFDTQLNVDDTPMTREQLAEAMSDCDVLVPTVSDDIDADLIAGAGDKLRMIAHFGNGVDNLDVAAAAAKAMFESMDRTVSITALLSFS